VKHAKFLIDDTVSAYLIDDTVSTYLIASLFIRTLCCYIKCKYVWINLCLFSIQATIDPTYDVGNPDPTLGTVTKMWQC
jgi:hypothetical protein